MLLRLSRLSLKSRGSAIRPLKRTPFAHFTSSDSHSPPFRFKRGYVFCAVGGIIAAVSIENEEFEDMGPLELPGRPGNLTAEETAKLKEMWSVAFKVFGIPEPNSEAESTETNSVAEVQRADTVD